MTRCRDHTACIAHYAASTRSNTPWVIVRKQIVSGARAGLSFLDVRRASWRSLRTKVGHCFADVSSKGVQRLTKDIVRVAFARKGTAQCQEFEVGIASIARARIARAAVTALHCTRACQLSNCCRRWCGISTNAHTLLEQSATP